MFQAIPSNASPKRLVRKYLEFCWSLPYYGSAFFRGQIETPAKSLTSLVINQDTEVIIAINSLGLHVIDPTNVVRSNYFFPSCCLISNVRLSCSGSSLRSSLGITPSLVKRTVKTVCLACSFNFVLLRMEEGFLRYSRYTPLTLTLLVLICKFKFVFNPRCFLVKQFRWTLSYNSGFFF